MWDGRFSWYSGYSPIGETPEEIEKKLHYYRMWGTFEKPTKPVVIGKLRYLWLRFSPEFYKAWVRAKSHRKFLAKTGRIDKDFGSKASMADLRQGHLNYIQNYVDPGHIVADRQIAKKESRSRLQALIRAAFDQYRK